MSRGYDFTPLTIHPDAVAALDPIRPLFKWPSVRWQKCLALYTLARQCRTGPIIELGAYHGCGTLALAYGSRDGAQVPVYTVDPFEPYDGWIGERYGPSDYDIFERNLTSLDMADGIEVIIQRSEDVAREWTTPYELLFWDIGGKRLFNDYLDWMPHCGKDGRIIVKDLTTWQFGFGNVFDHATHHGFVRDVSHVAGCMWVIRRTT